jgi:hypothetical protein
MEEKMSEQTQAQEAQGVELTIQDLAVIRSIIDTASTRGAFKANELEVVGKTFNKLDGFLNSVQQANEAEGEKKDG